MAKRFISTGLFDDSFFMNLTPEGKLFFLYLITKCDHAGIIDINIQLAEFQIGTKGLAKSFPTLKEQLGNRLIFLRENYFFLPKFIEFQYPNGLNKSVKAHESVIKRLIEFDLFDLEKQTLKEQLKNSCQTVQDKDMVSEEVKVKEEKKEIEKLIYPFDTPLFTEVWQAWKDYKKTEHKFSYKSANSEQAALVELDNISNHNLDNCIKIIRKSIASGWKGFFELKESQTSNSPSAMNDFKNSLANRLKS